MYDKRSYCIFAAQYLPHMGGVERYTYNLAKKLIQYGNQVTIVTSNTEKLLDYEVTEGIHIYRVPCVNLLDGRYPILKINKTFIKLHKTLSSKQFDMVIVNTRFYLHSLYGMVFARLKRTHSITIEHGTSHLSVHNKLLDYFGSIYEHFLTKIGLLFCKNYYGVSMACNEWLKHFHIQAKGVLYNSIDIDEIETVKRRVKSIYRDKYNISKDAIVIAFTGRLLKEKGLPSLLNVMERICRERDDVYLLIAGDGDMQQEIHQRSSSHIIPLGRLDFEHVVGMLKESDIFCLPSFSEGFSTSILEAIACECYILTTARGGAKELLITEEYGKIISNNDEEILFVAMKECLDDSEKREHAIKLAYERLSKYFTWDIVAQNVRNICKQTEE